MMATRVVYRGGVVYKMGCGIVVYTVIYGTGTPAGILVAELLHRRGVYCTATACCYLVLFIHRIILLSLATTCAPMAIAAGTKSKSYHSNQRHHVCTALANTFIS